MAPLQTGRLSKSEVISATERNFQGQRVIPRIGHQRLCIVSPPPHRMNFHQIYNDLEEDQNEMVLVPMRRSQLATRKLIYLDDYFNSTNDVRADWATGHLRSGRSFQEIEAETRGIKRDADSLLLRLACGYKPPMYSLRSIPLRNALELKDTVDVRRHYVHERNMVDPIKRVQNEILRMSMYKEPMRKAAYIGRGHLACLSYAGGRPISKRRRFYPEDDKIRDDVTFRSYYTALRAAANIGKEYKKPLYQPIYRSKRSILGITNEKKEERKEVESKWESRCKSPKDSRRPDPVKSVTLPTPRKSVVEMPVAPAPEPSQECRVTLPKPRQSVTEEPTEEPELPVENVVVKVPRKSVSAEPPAIPQPAKCPETKEKTPEVESAPEEPQAPAEPEPQAPVEPEPEPPTEPEPEPVPEPAAAEVAEPPAPEPEPEPTPAEPVVEAEVSAPAEPEPTAEEVPPEPAPEVPQSEAPAQEPAPEAPVEEPAAAAPAEEPTAAEEAEKGEDEESDVAVQVDEDEEMSVGEESDREIATPVAEPESEDAPVEEPKEEESRQELDGDLIREDVSVAEEEVFAAAEPEPEMPPTPTPESPSEE